MSGKGKSKFEFFQKLNFFFLKFKFWFFFARQLRMTILDCCISLKMIKKNFGCVGSCEYAPASVKSLQFYFYFWWMTLLQKFKNRSSSVQRDDLGVFIFFDSFSNNVIHQEVNGHVLYLDCVIYVSFIPYFRLLVFGILVTLVAWFSFLFFRLAHLALQNVNKDYVIFLYFRNFVGKSDQKPKTKNLMNETKMTSISLKLVEVVILIEK